MHYYIQPCASPANYHRTREVRLLVTRNNNVHHIRHQVCMVSSPAYGQLSKKESFPVPVYTIAIYARYIVPGTNWYNYLLFANCNAPSYCNIIGEIAMQRNGLR